MTAALRPLIAAPNLAWFKRLNYPWWLMRLPMALLGLPAAYGVGAFAGEHLPWPFNWIAGGAFETAYLGAIAMADQQHDQEDQVSTYLWWAVNVGAVLASIACNLLFVAGFRFANVIPESFVHAVPMPVLGFLYGLMLHRQAAKTAAAAAAVERRREAAEAATAFKCDWCGIGKASPAAVRGHKRHCTRRPH